MNGKKVQNKALTNNETIKVLQEISRKTGYDFYLDGFFPAIIDIVIKGKIIFIHAFANKEELMRFYTKK